MVVPFHLCTLARIAGEASVAFDGPVTILAILDALEAKYPALRGTIRDHDSSQRRPMLRFFACNRDFSNEPLDTPLPAAIATGQEPFLIIGAIAGG
ncbi:MAG TPA: MoaD/ThiS family protein [Phycisphaerales bacterium]|nr:MoaD/ThiS family protein [Phycisphaerales bacterium]